MAAIAEFGNLERARLVQLLIDGKIDHAHAAFGDLLRNPESSGDQGAAFKRVKMPDGHSHGNGRWEPGVRLLRLGVRRRHDRATVPRKEWRGYLHTLEKGRQTLLA